MVIVGDANSISTTKSQETLFFAHIHFDRGDGQDYCNRQLCISMVSLWKVASEDVSPVTFAILKMVSK
jgi:hypothetical protein